MLRNPLLKLSESNNLLDPTNMEMKMTMKNKVYLDSSMDIDLKSSKLKFKMDFDDLLLLYNYYGIYSDVLSPSITRAL